MCVCVRQWFLGVFTPTVCLLCSESVDELVHSEHFPLGSVSFSHREKSKQTKMNHYFHVSTSTLLIGQMCLGVGARKCKQEELAFAHNRGNYLGNIPGETIPAEWR